MPQSSERKGWTVNQSGAGLVSGEEGGGGEGGGKENVQEVGEVEMGFSVRRKEVGEEGGPSRRGRSLVNFEEGGGPVKGMKRRVGEAEGGAPQAGERSFCRGRRRDHRWM